MNVTFDRPGNAAYIYLKEIEDEEAVRQHVHDDPHHPGHDRFVKPS